MARRWRTPILAPPATVLLTALERGIARDAQEPAYNTRITLPSRMGAGWLKAMLQIAPAV
jgi:hypothetical protein